MGIVLGTLAALFIHLLQRSTLLFPGWPVWLRFTLGGLAVGLLALVAPEIMGIGYDTVNRALLGQLGLVLLITITLFKLVATAFGLGMGLPGGLIGPTLVIGAVAGGTMGTIAVNWLPGEFSSPAFYALIGMGTMMGATLQAPLAALMAMLELTANPNIILPGMLALITAGMVSRELFGKESVYLELIRARGLDYRDSPLTQALRRIGVASVMDRNIEALPQYVDYKRAGEALAREPRWIVISERNKPVSLMPAADLARHLQVAAEKETLDETIDLNDIPAQRREISPIDFKATLQEAHATLKSTGVEALYVIRRTIPGIDVIYGVLTRSELERSYTLD
jgi:CIC family chloride channel protein